MRAQAQVGRQPGRAINQRVGLLQAGADGRIVIGVVRNTLRRKAATWCRAMGEPTRARISFRMESKMGDNEFVIVPKAFARPDEFASAVAEVEPMLSPEVVRLRHSLGEDWSGEPAVFFLVTLSDTAASRLDQLGRLAHHISTTIERQIEPSEYWGVYPFFRYRSQSEQAVLKEKAWA